MKPSTFSEEQIIAVLKEATMPAAAACHRHGVGSAMFCKWKSNTAAGSLRPAAPAGSGVKTY
jgi:hypothetical protein